jgi:hypothetical protein
VVSGDADGIRYLQTLTGESARSIFEHASEGGEVHFSAGTTSYLLRRNPDYTFSVTLATNHRTHLTGG